MASGLRSQAMEFTSNLTGNEELMEVSFSVRHCYNPICCFSKIESWGLEMKGDWRGFWLEPDSCTYQGLAG